jgi:hypothetical protein
LIAFARKAISFYAAQIETVREAINCWSVIGIRLCVVKDIRIVIGKMVWKMRWEAKYTGKKRDPIINTN